MKKKYHIMLVALCLSLIGLTLFVNNVNAEQEKEMSKAQALCFETKFTDNDFIADIRRINLNEADEFYLNMLRDEINCMELE